MRLFFVSSTQWSEKTVTITGQDVHHIVRVLRLKAGDMIAVSDGEGRVGRVQIDKLDDEAVEGSVVEESGVLAVEGPSITLVQGLPKGRKFDLIIQKSVELGVSRILPVATARTVVSLEGRRAAERLERWRRIASEASKQCRRHTIPEVAPLTNLDVSIHALGPPEAGQIRLLLWEEASEPLREVLARADKPSSVVCLVGPEGGLEEAEAALATEAGFVPASLGSRILRTETAPIALLAVLQFAFGGF